MYYNVDSEPYSLFVRDGVDGAEDANDDSSTENENEKKEKEKEKSKKKEKGKDINTTSNNITSFNNTNHSMNINLNRPVSELFQLEKVYNLSRAGDGKRFLVKDFAPEGFQSLRHLFGITNQDYLVCIYCQYQSLNQNVTSLLFRNRGAP